MKALIQRVRQARVEVAGEVVGAIDQGLLVLVGVEREDDRARAVVDAPYQCGASGVGELHGHPRIASPRTMLPSGSFRYSSGSPRTHVMTRMSSALL